MGTDDEGATAAGRASGQVASRPAGVWPDLGDHLAAWTAAGLIDSTQAGAIARWEQTKGSSVPASRRSVFVEALAYVGGAVIAAALVTITVGYWERFDRATHIAIPAAATAILFVAGLAIPSRLGDAGVRARSTVWLVSVPTLIGLLVVLVDVPSIADGWRVGAGAAIYAVALWLAHRTVLQHAAAFGTVAFFAVSLAQTERDTGTAIGVVMAVVSLVWGLASWGGLLPGQGRWLAPASPTRRTSSWAAAAPQRGWGIGLAAIGLAVSATVLSSTDRAPWVGVLPVLVILAAAIALGHVAIVVIGALAALIAVPVVAGHYLQSTLAVALVLLATGAVMVLFAVLIVRRRARSTPDSRAAPASGTGDAASTSSSTRSAGSAPG
jgi:hypothetical protein